ncbi:uncharacterized protein LOC131658343 [Vicia villosa]|uniref:uncharacterized protein LOC131658343 n=1 Tax=Vicia villosa TaxID=3911 RepID=UPI00273B1AD0|nr:uncharacterized protein LOC131658343 [Vicia villosa]
MDLQKAYNTVEWSALENIMKEHNFPQKFIDWTMICIETVSYRYTINGQASKILKAKRGLRQGDPISPLLFVLIMEYLHRCMVKLKDNSHYKFHPKCARMRISNICFADDLLLFARGDESSVIQMMTMFQHFSATTGLKANPKKCKVYFGVAAYWMQVFPLPKKIIHQVEAVCRDFLWSGKENSKKAPIAWDKVCDPKSAGGLNITALEDWNKATMLKLLWNIHGKKDKLWVKWLDAYYMKGRDLFQIQNQANWSWMLKQILKERDDIEDRQTWSNILHQDRFHTKQWYQAIRGEKEQLP